jgi:pimeloyl-ACP methyl ester carboxylesterase
MIRRAYLDGRWGQLHVRRAGQGTRLLLLHQSPLSGAMFDAAMPFLAAAGIEAVALDTPGFGLSDAPPAPTTIHAYGEVVGDALDSLGWDRAAILGHHTGAAIGASFAARNPGRVERLILNGVPLLTPEQLEHFKAFRFSPLLPEADGSHLIAAWNQRLAASPGWTDLDAMHRYVVEMLAKNLTYWWGFQAALAHDIAPDLAAISVPTMVFSNSGEDLYASSKAAHARRAEWVWAELAGGTHDIVDEQPEPWARVVADFVLAKMRPAL